MLKVFMWVLWPSFLVAVVGAGVFFSVFDPKDLPWLDRTVTLTPQAAHTIGFFFFWLLGAISSIFSILLSFYFGPDQDSK